VAATLSVIFMIAVSGMAEFVMFATADSTAANTFAVVEESIARPCIRLPGSYDVAFHVFVYFGACHGASCVRLAKTPSTVETWKLPPLSHDLLPNSFSKNSQCL